MLIESEQTSINFITMKGHRRFSVILFVAGVLLVDFASSRCYEDTDCPHQDEICCARNFTCRTKRGCHLWCLIHGHCPRGKHCVNSRCVSSSRNTQFCSAHGDCYNNSTFITQNLKCCNGRCLNNIFRCSILTTTTATATRSGSSCINGNECANGEQCEEGRCKESSNAMLTKAGFLSAAILTGSVFLLILCCCFVRESRYSRQRYAERQRRRSRNRRRSRQSRRRSSQNTTAVENRAFRTEDCSDCEGGFFIPLPEYPGELTIPDGTQSPPQSTEEQSPSPPPYYTLSFELPPPYEEAVQTEENKGTLAEVA